MEKSKGQKWKNSILWTSGALSSGLCYLLISQLTYALTESYAMSAMSVGMIFMASRLFDGITDFIAGNIIDRTHTKWGKARIYDLAQIIAWFFVVLCFSVPSGLSEIGKIIFVFLMYNLYTSVFSTFSACANTVRLKRSLDEEGRIHAISVSGVAASLFATVISIALPLLIGKFGNQPYGWTIIALIFAVPNCLLSLIRFIFLPEKYTDDEKEAKKEQIGIIESVKLLITNKYAIILLIMTLFRALIVTATGSAGTYYFTYVYGDVTAASIPAMVSMITVFAAALLPVLVKKLGNKKTVMYALILGIAAFLLRYLMPTNLIWYTLMNLVTTTSTLPISYLGDVMLIDAMEYGRWKNGKTPEGVYASVRSISDKLGLGFGSAVMGIILQSGALAGGGYTAASIQFLNNGFPAFGWFICVVVLLFYDLDKKMPQVKKELAEREA